MSEACTCSYWVEASVSSEPSSDYADNPPDYWDIPTVGYSGSHYAVFPPALVEKPVKAMAPTKVCRTCGQPSTRIMHPNPDYEGRAGGTTNKNAEQGASLKGISHKRTAPPAFIPGEFSDCGHDDWRAGVVLDPFAGSGTTLQVATGLGRAAIGFDLDARNVHLARERVGMFLDEHTLGGLS